MKLEKQDITATLINFTEWLETNCYNKSSDNAFTNRFALGCNCFFERDKKGNIEIIEASELVKIYLTEQKANLKQPIISKSIYTQSFKKIPIKISKFSDGGINGWRAEIADNYENYKTSQYDKINFEDLSFHFKHNTTTHEMDTLLFYRRNDALECAKYVNKTYLGGKAKIWFI